MNKQKKVRKHTFTLVELLVVLLILGVLVGLAVPRYMESQKAARARTFAANVRQIVSALEAYRMDTTSDGGPAQYPGALSDLQKKYFTQEPINPYTGKSMLSSTTTDSGLLYQSTGPTYKLCVVQRDIEDVNNNGVVDEVLPLTTKSVCIGDMRSNIQLTFIRPSVAYTSGGTQVGVNVPRFEAGKFGQAIMVEEETTNALSYAFTSDTKLLQYYYLNFTGIQDSSSVTIDATQTPPLSGQKVVKHYAAVNGSYIMAKDAYGVFYDAASTAKLAVTGGSYVTFSIWAKGQNGGEQIKIYIFDYASDTGSFRVRKNQTFTITNTWQRYVVTVQTASDAVRAWARVDNNLAGQTVYWCAPQLENEAYATSFTPSTRSPETLTIPTAGVLNPQEGTVEFWVYVPEFWKQGIPYWRRIWGIGRNARAGMYVLYYYPNTGKIHFTIYNSSGVAQIISVDKPTVGWHFFAAKWSASEMALFIDGVKVGSIANPSLPSSFADTVISIGCRPDSPYDNVNTLIDDLRISNRARTDEEIAAAYQSGQPLPVDEWTTYKLGFDDNLNFGQGGYYLSPEFDLSAVGTAATSAISWQEDADGIQRTVYAKLDNQTDWTQVQNGGKLPISTGELLAGRKLQLKTKLLKVV